MTNKDYLISVGEICSLTEKLSNLSYRCLVSHTLFSDDAAVCSSGFSVFTSVLSSLFSSSEAAVESTSIFSSTCENRKESRL